jgi:hypothetical protein
MRVLCAAALIALMAAPAYAQAEKRIPKYGEADKDKTPAEIAAEKAAQKAYTNSLGNIPDQGATDPWGTVRSPGAPKPVAKSAAKTTGPKSPTKTGGTAN